MIYLWLFLLGSGAFYGLHRQFISALGPITPSQLALVYDKNRAISHQIAQNYADARGVPQRNLIPVSLQHQDGVITPQKFKRLKRYLDKRAPAQVQAFMLMWDSPYRVGCMSLGTAMTFGFDHRYCQKQGCQTTLPSPYFNYSGHQPYFTLGIRPSMLLGSTNSELANKLIARGLVADNSHPAGQVLLAHNQDQVRNVRQEKYHHTLRQFSEVLPVRRSHSEHLGHQQDILLYTVGAKRVTQLNHLRFVPGGVADHLTSFGGLPPKKAKRVDQMSAVEWLKQGATASYGTVTEPCNFPEKFPQPDIFLTHYLAGDTLLEAYWKSVAMPGQGNFIGEPLARPFSATKHDEFVAP